MFIIALIGKICGKENIFSQFNKNIREMRDNLRQRKILRQKFSSCNLCV